MFLQPAVCLWLLYREEQLRRELDELVAAASAVQATEASLAVAETSRDALRGAPPVKVGSGRVQGQQCVDDSCIRSAPAQLRCMFRLSQSTPVSGCMVSCVCCGALCMSVGFTSLCTPVSASKCQLAAAV
jgi:hypothetical protein